MKGVKPYPRDVGVAFDHCRALLKRSTFRLMLGVQIVLTIDQRPIVVLFFDYGGRALLISPQLVGQSHQLGKDPSEMLYRREPSPDVFTAFDAMPNLI